MIARVASFEGIDPDLARARSDEIGAVAQPVMERLAGYRGTLNLVSADGKELLVTFFDTEENADAAEQTFDEELPRLLAGLYEGWEGRRVSVDRYEVLVDMRG